MADSLTTGAHSKFGPSENKMSACLTFSKKWTQPGNRNNFTLLWKSDILTQLRGGCMVFTDAEHDTTHSEEYL